MGKAPPGRETPGGLSFRRWRQHRLQKLVQQSPLAFQILPDTELLHGDPLVVKTPCRHDPQPWHPALVPDPVVSTESPQPLWKWQDPPGYFCTHREGPALTVLHVDKSPSTRSIYHRWAGHIHRTEDAGIRKNRCTINNLLEERPVDPNVVIEDRDQIHFFLKGHHDSRRPGIVHGRRGCRMDTLVMWNRLDVRMKKISGIVYDDQ